MIVPRRVSSYITQTPYRPDSSDGEKPVPGSWQFPVRNPYPACDQPGVVFSGDVVNPPKKLKDGFPCRQVLGNKPVECSKYFLTFYCSQLLMHVILLRDPLCT